MMIQSPSRRRSVRPLAVALLLPLAVGCGADGPARAPVSGSVTVGGEPLKSGVIRFVPAGETKGPATAATVSDGRYELPASDGPLVGMHRIEVEGLDHFGFALDDEAAFTRHALRHRGRLPPNPVPAVYRGGRSPLSAEVPPEGRDDLNFSLNGSRRTLAGR